MSTLLVHVHTVEDYCILSYIVDQFSLAQEVGGGRMDIMLFKIDRISIHLKLKSLDIHVKHN